MVKGWGEVKGGSRFSKKKKEKKEINDKINLAKDILMYGSIKQILQNHIQERLYISMDGQFYTACSDLTTKGKEPLKEDNSFLFS